MTLRKQRHTHGRRSSLCVLVLLSIGTLQCQPHRPSSATPRSPTKTPQAPATAVDDRLRRAATLGDVEETRAALAKGANPNAPGPGGYTALHFAVRAKHREVVRELIKGGADVEARTSVTSVTPLHLAAMKGDRPLVDALLAAGAERVPRSRDGSTPAEFARGGGHADLARYLDSLR